MTTLEYIEAGFAWHVRGVEEMSLVQSMPRAWKGACMLVLLEEVCTPASISDS